MSKKNTPDRDNVNYGEKLAYVKEAIACLQASMTELREYRSRHQGIETSYNNVFTGPMTADDHEANILRSGFTHVAVEQAMRGMLMPLFRADAVNRTGTESKNARFLAEGGIEWFIKESGFSSAYIDSKEEWAKAGDSFRRPFVIPLKKAGQFWPQYEDIDPTCILLDVSGAVIWSETVSKSMSYVGYTRIYTGAQIKREFGREVYDAATPGAMIDHERFAEYSGRSEDNNEKYFEVIIYQSCADETELVLVGKNALPISVNIEGKSAPRKPAEIKDIMKATNKYIHRDKFGRAVLRFYQNFFYYDNSAPRNRGLIDKLASIQIAHEDLENTKLESTKLRMFEVPTVAGGREAAIKKSISNFIRERRTNTFAVLHAPQSGVDGIPPKFDMLRFNGVSADDATQATKELYDLARNVSGIAVSRLEVAESATLGQSQIIEQEKVDSIESIIMRNKPLLEHEYEGILDFIIEMDGFGLDDVMISVEYYKEFDGLAGEEGKERLTTREISIKDLARELKETRFKVVIDDSSLVNRTYSTMMDEWVKLLGMINPAEQPELYKLILQRIGKAGRFDIPEDILSQKPQQAQAMGGASQFQSGSSEAPAEAEMPMPGGDVGALSAPSGVMSMPSAQ